MILLCIANYDIVTRLVLRLYAYTGGKTSYATNLANISHRLADVWGVRLLEQTTKSMISAQMSFTRTSQHPSRRKLTQ